MERNPAYAEPENDRAPQPVNPDAASAQRVRADANPHDRHNGAAERATRTRASSSPSSSAAGVRTPATGARRLLIPIDATPRSRWAVQYALAQGRDAALHIDLLFVAEPIVRPEVLRFRTQADIAEFQAQRARWLLEDAAQPLQSAGVAVHGHFREGEIPAQIVNAAEELGCEEIVLPVPHARWMRLLCRDVVREVQKRAPAAPVVTVDESGRPAR